MECSICHMGSIINGICSYCGNFVDATVLAKDSMKKMRELLESLEKKQGKRSLACIINPRTFTGMMDLPEILMTGSVRKEFDTGFVTGQMGLYGGLQVYLDEE